MRKTFYTFVLIGTIGAIVLFLLRCGVFQRIDEASGLVASRQHTGIFWTLNDSGGEPELYAINEARELVSVVRVSGATNEDWEAITQAPNGDVYIGDIGNNGNERRNLGVYRIREPSRLQPVDQPIEVAAEYFRFTYPEQKGFPDEAHLNFDAEALFYFSPKNGEEGHLYLLTKHRSDTRTNLYVFPSLSVDDPVSLRRVDSFDVGGESHWFGGRVTGAAIHSTQRLLAVLTYHQIFVFALESNEVRLDTLVASIELKQSHTQQVEGIAWRDNTLLFVNEQGDMFRLPEEQWRLEGAVFPLSD